ncbi:MAG: peptidoglycan-binding protein [Candidatus Taylorbacteria bacterium]
MKKYSILTFLFACLVSVFFYSPSYARAEFSSTPDSNIPITDGTVSAVVANSSGTYIGGTFTHVGSTVSGNGVPIVTSTGLPVSTFPKVNGTISSVVSDRNGGWYIGGAFTQVGTETRNRLAHILPDGTVDPNFNPDMSGTVVALALSPDGATLYAGGGFTTVGGAPYNNLAAINTADGIATSFNPNMSSTVSALALSPDVGTLYAGGFFTTVGGAPYNRLVAINTLDGIAISTFINPNMNNAVVALALSGDGTKLYAGGRFTTVGGAPYNNLAAINTSNGIATSFNPNMGSTFIGVSALSLSPDGATLYAGGQFTNVGGPIHYYLAAINTADGIATSFNPNLNNFGFVSALALSSDGTKLYAGGQFTTVGGAPYNFLVAINTSDGIAISTFNPSVNSSVGALALSPDGGTLYAGGNFTIIGGIVRNNLAHILPDGTVDPNFNPNMSGIVSALALSPDGTTLYAGGQFTTVGGAPYNRLVAINTADGIAISFNPNMNGGVSALALSSDGATLYAGGSFTTVGGGGAPYNRLAAINTADGIATSFNPNMSSTVSALALSGDGGTLYAGGLFTTVGGVTAYNRLAAINTSNGIATSFNPNMNNGVLALALSPDGGTLYAGGFFTTVGGVTAYNRLAAINTSDGIATSFNPNMNNQVNALALSGDGGTLYAGGLFTTVGGVTAYNRLAAINTSDGIATSFNPNMNNSVSALALSSDGTKLYAGGDFTTVGGNPEFQNFVSFSAIPEEPVPTPTPSRRRSSSGGRSANFIPQSPLPSNAPTCASGYTLIPFPANPSGYMCSPNASGIAPVVEITPGIGLPPVLTPLSFTRNLGSGSVGSDVKLLQQYLNSKGFTLALVGAGSPGNETTFFGMLTRTALSRFQLAHGITPPVGFFGPITRGFILRP